MEAKKTKGMHSLASMSTVAGSALLSSVASSTGGATRDSAEALERRANMRGSDVLDMIMTQRELLCSGNDDTNDAGSDGIGSQDEELTTHKPRENPESTSKPSNKRGPKRRARKAEAYLKRSQEIITASGGTFVPGLHHGGVITVEDGLHTLSELKSQRDSEPDATTDVFDKFRFSELALSKVDQEAMDETALSINKWGEQYNHCPLCLKVWDEWHTRTDRHLSNLDLQTIMDGLLGRPLIPRPLNKGMPGRLTQEAVLNHWGPQVPLLCRRFMSELSKGGRILKYKRSKTAKAWELKPETVRAASTVMVTYTACQGFYKDSDYAISFDELPEGPHSDTVGPEPPFGREWWPTVQIHADELDCGSSAASTADTEEIWVSCIYQITEVEVWIWKVRRARL